MKRFLKSKCYYRVSGQSRRFDKPCSIHARKFFTAVSFLGCLLLLTAACAVPAGADESVPPFSMDPAVSLPTTSTLFAVPVAPSPAFPASYTLAQSIEQALKTSPRIGTYAYRTLSANKDADIAYTQMFPSASLSAGRSYVRNESYSGLVDPDYVDQHVDTLSVQLYQTIFAGMTLLNGYQKAQLSEELAKAEQQSVADRVVLDVQITFFDLIKSQGEVRSLLSAVKRLQSSADAVRAYERVRLAPYVDVLQAEVDLADAQQQLSKTENKVATLKVTLNMLLGLPPVTSVEYVGDLESVNLDLPWTLEQCLERAMTQRPDLLVRRKALAMAEKEAEIVYGRFFPRIDLQGGFVSRDVTYDSTVGIGAVDRDYKTDYWTSGINLQWRFFESGRTQSEYQRALHQTASLREQLRDTESQVSTQVHTAFLSLNEARQRIALAENTLGQAAEGQARSQVRFEARVGTVVELLDTQARLTRAETNHLQALADFRQAMAQLTYAMGERNPVAHF
jgi:outer membrane protein TolC